MQVIVALGVIAFGLAGVVVALAALFSLPVMFLWDWLMPTLFGLPEITWLQAWGLMVLCGFFCSSHRLVSLANQT